MSIKPVFAGLLLSWLCVACGSNDAGTGGTADPLPSAGSTLAEVEVDCPESARSESAFAALGILDEHGPIFPSSRQRSALKAFVQKRDYQFWCHDQFRDLDLRMTGPVAPVASRTKAEDEPSVTAFTTHSRVRVYYSETMLEWMADGRQGAVPDGAVMIKEMHPSRPGIDPTQIDGHAVMVKDSAASRDGWLWYLHYDTGNSAYTLPFVGAQYGNNFCLSCHAAATSESTFATFDNLLERDVPTYLSLTGRVPSRTFGTTHGRIPTEAFGLDSEDSEATLPGSDPLEDWSLTKCITKLRGNPSEEDFFGCVMFAPMTAPHAAPANPAFTNWFAQALRSPNDVAARLPKRLPLDLLYDHVPPPPDGNDWLTASTCYACHDTADLLNGTNAEMSVPLGDHGKAFDHLYPLELCWKTGGCKDAKPDKLAASQYAEWSGSLMSVSSRDPVFRAQLESETARYPEQAAQTTELCLSCHAPAGKRFAFELATNLSNTYANAADDDFHAAKFGALARDGVTCAICHRIADDNLGEPASFTAQFTLDPPDVVNGPPLSNGDLQTDPMQTALGVTPRFADHVTDSGLCGTCHMVDTPVYDNENIDFAHEQTTYLEWKNSSFVDEPGQTCQGCHMPDVQPLARDEATTGAIANYEDSEFPFVPNRKRAALVDTVDRPGYRRHTLVGINVFTMGFFQQFPFLLGSHTFSPTRQFTEIVPPRALAMNEALRLAREETVMLTAKPVLSAEKPTIDVDVTNLVGHKFPSGVGFRRAFLEVEALDAGGKRLWCSGCTNTIGVITDTGNTPLPTEVAIESTAWQPDFEVVQSDSEVQIYETRHTNAKGQLTTSFVELNEEVKDNRLLPRGWDYEGYPEYEMNPKAASATERSEVDRVRYEMPANLKGRIDRVRITMHYQALPPYYLLDRISLLKGTTAQHPETQRLLHLMLRMKIGDKETHGSRAIKDWKLRVGSTVELKL